MSDLDDRKPYGIEVDGVPVVLVREGEVVHALRDECSHAEVPLSEGELTRRGLECWLHGSCFELRTGAPSSPPATDPVDVFAVEVRDGEVHVDVTTRANTIPNPDDPGAADRNGHSRDQGPARRRRWGLWTH